jgi:hypothetical protein
MLHRSFKFTRKQSYCMEKFLPWQRFPSHDAPYPFSAPRQRKFNDRNYRHARNVLSGDVNSLGEVTIFSSNVLELRLKGAYKVALVRKRTLVLSSCHDAPWTWSKIRAMMPLTNIWLCHRRGPCSRYTKKGLTKNLSDRVASVTGRGRLSDETWWME